MFLLLAPPLILILNSLKLTSISYNLNPDNINIIFLTSSLLSINRNLKFLFIKEFIIFYLINYNFGI